MSANEIVGADPLFNIYGKILCMFCGRIGRKVDVAMQEGWKLPEDNYRTDGVVHGTCWKCEREQRAEAIP